MELDRQSIERRDFPIARRGYDPAAVDAHLRALAVEIDELRWHSADSHPGESLGAAAAGHVQSILDAAEASAADIERQAAEDARRTRDEAARDAERTRTEMAQRTQGHIEAVARAAAVLLARVESMDGEVSALVQSLRTGAGRLAADLGSVETDVGELYDSLSAQTAAAVREPEPEPEPEPAWVEPPAELAADPVTESIPAVGSTPAASAAFTAAPITAPTGPAAEPAATPVAPPPHAVPPPALGDDDPQAGWPTPPAAPRVGEGAVAANGDLDGARLVALNMALNGEPREQADRYLAEHFQLADRAKLLDEVYAAIEG